MARIRIAFFGTHTFAAHILGGLLDDASVSVVRVITRPDRPVGRKQTLSPSPVKTLAESRGIPTDQPSTLKTYALPSDIDLCVVAQYGLLIPTRVLDAPQYGCINVHTSLLPKYRGASPIQTALMNGDRETGITIMKMDERLDTGPILLQKRIAIAEDDTYLRVEEKLIPTGIAALREAIAGYCSGTLKPIPQDNAAATVCREYTKDDGRAEWIKPNMALYNRWRALTPWPGLWTMLGDKRIKLLRVSPAADTLEPGVLRTRDGRLLVGCGSGSLLIEELQPEGKNPMSASAFILGHAGLDGTRLS
jgi:methionyl-tRNA formyltransferase